MKKKILVLIFLSLFSLLKVNAAYSPSYYVTKDNKYVLCPVVQTNQCFEIKRNEKGAIFNLKENQISYNGITYVFSEDFQRIYNSSQQSQIKNVFYINRKGNYAICDSLDYCELYTYNDLLDKAIINPGVSVIINGKTYLYNEEVQADANKGKEPGVIAVDHTKNNTNVGGSEEGESPSRPPKEELPAKTDYCTVRLKEPLKFIGRIVLIVKIIIPIIIVIFGFIDFFKAVTGAKDDEIKKSGRSLALRLLAGVVIFLIPTIVSVVFSLVDSWMDIKGDFNACQKCIFRVSECE